MRLCEAAFGICWTYDGERFRARRHAWRSASNSRLHCARSRFPTGRTGPLGALVARRARSSMFPISTDPKSTGRRSARVGDWSIAAAPARCCWCRLRKDDELLGVISRLSPGGAAVFRQADRAVAELRGAGGHRDGECAADHRDARGAGAADRDRRGAGRSSTPRPATSRRCSTRCSKRRRGCARHPSAFSEPGTVSAFIPVPCTATRAFCDWVRQRGPDPAGP